MHGYWNKPEQTAQAVRDGWMHTGDGAWMDEDGFIFIADRLKDMIISGGENVYSAEVENALAQHPAVAACAVIGVPERAMGRDGACRGGAQARAGSLGRRSDRALQVADRRLQMPAQRGLRRRAAAVRRRQGAEDQSCASPSGTAASARSADAMSRDIEPRANGPAVRHERSISWQARWVELLLRVIVKRRMAADVDLAALRHHYEEVDSGKFRAPPDAERTHADAAGVPCEWLDLPQSRPERVLLYIHGGGFIVRMPNLYARFAARVGRALGARVLLVDYRLAPEHPFPGRRRGLPRGLPLVAGAGYCRAQHRDRR